MMKFLFSTFSLVTFISYPLLGFAQSAPPPATSFKVTCPASNGAAGPDTFVSTNIVMRNSPSNTLAFTVTNVKIYRDNGALLFNGIPTGLTTRIVPAAAVGFSTQPQVGNYVGRLTVVTTVRGSSNQSLIEFLAANFDTDGNGKLLSRDTITCSR